MAIRQRKIKPAQKKGLIAEAGGKCANPGCSNWQLHIHHIKHWSVYKCHDSKEMIAICPSCHDAAHHGMLKIDDETMYQWKGIERSHPPNNGQIYVEPARELKLLTGTIAFSTQNGQATIFELSNSNRLEIRLLDGDILQVNSRILNLHGKEVLRVVENHVRVACDTKVKFEFRAGRARVTIPATADYVPQWAIEQMKVDYPNFAENCIIVAVELEVLKPGLLRVQGCWPSPRCVVVIGVDALSFCQPGMQRPFSIVGAGESTVIMYSGPVTNAIFGLPS